MMFGSHARGQSGNTRGSSTASPQPQLSFSACFEDPTDVTMGKLSATSVHAPGATTPSPSSSNGGRDSNNNNNGNMRLQVSALFSSPPSRACCTIAPTPYCGVRSTTCVRACARRVCV